MSGAIQFGRAVITLGIDDKTQADMRKWASQAKAFAVASAAIAGAAAALKSFASQGAAIQDIADRTGLAASQVSALGYAARQSGTDVDALQGAISRMAKVFTAADEESKSAVESLRQLGLTADALQQMSVNDRFLAIADAISKVPDPSMRSAYAMEIFGKAAVNLMPLLAEGRQGIKSLTDEAERLGLVWSDDMAAAAAKLDDQLVRLNDQWEKLVANTGYFAADTGVVGVLSNIASEASNATNELRLLFNVMQRAAKRGQLGGGPAAASLFMATQDAPQPPVPPKSWEEVQREARELMEWSDKTFGPKPTAVDLMKGLFGIDPFTSGVALAGTELEIQKQREADARARRKARAEKEMAKADEMISMLMNQIGGQLTSAPGALDARSIQAFEQAYKNSFSQGDKSLQVLEQIKAILSNPVLREAVG